MSDSPSPSSPSDDPASGTTTGLDRFGDDRRVVVQCLQTRQPRGHFAGEGVPQSGQRRLGQRAAA